MTGAEVRRIRHGLHLTQAALARELGVTRVTVARWESGVYTPSRNRPRGCCNVFATSAGKRSDPGKSPQGGSARA